MRHICAGATNRRRNRSDVTALTAHRPGRFPSDARLAPSIPSVFASGTNACGDPYAVNAATLRRTIPLLNCPGQAGLNPLPTITIRTGQQLLLSGVKPGYRVTVSPLGLVRREAETYTAIGRGRVLFTIHDYPFCQAPTVSDACPLLNVAITEL